MKTDDLLLRQSTAEFMRGARIRKQRRLRMMQANELHSLPKNFQLRLKHDINNAIHRFQCLADRE